MRNDQVRTWALRIVGVAIAVLVLAGSLWLAATILKSVLPTLLLIVGLIAIGSFVFLGRKK